jgi:leucyl-tRNA synthetase
MMKAQSYNHKTIEKKWSKVWADTKIYQPDLKNSKNPFYNLMMFPYPSAEGLHVGNMYAFTGADVYGRFKRMSGFDVFEPIGLDGFGIHSENYAIKIGKHPKEQAKISEKHFYEQLHTIGNGFAWDNALETYDPNYYKWTQWLFTKMFKHGLAYRKKAYVNWCPSCKTVLADEQVETGLCERCKSEVVRKEMEQWFFKITDYANKLLSGLSQIKWPKKITSAQKLWIGKKAGINITYSIEGTDQTIVCFTTRPDTNFGATFVVLAPELALDFMSVIPESNKTEVKEYIEKSLKKSEQERIAEGRAKTGVFTGLYAINPLNKYKMPMYVTDFVLKDVGTGAVVGVPGHDKRDFEFAKEFKLPIVRVVVGSDKDTKPITNIHQVQEKEGTMINSEFLNGMEIHEAIGKMMDYLENKGWGKRTYHYHLRDWLISRQRYWGPPIPMIYCKSCANKRLNALVIHGTWGTGEGNWFPWLKLALESKQINTVNPTLPDTKLPDYAVRMNYLKSKYSPYLSTNSIIIGHSSGAPTVLHLAEKYKLNKVILVAPVLYVDKDYKKDLIKAFNKETADALEILVNRTINPEKIRKNINELIIFFGAHDPYIPARFHAYAKKTFPYAKIRILPYKHFSNATNDPKSLPELLDYIEANNSTGWVPVPEKDLPVLLPDISDWKPKGDGKGPLEKAPKEWLYAKCPKCGNKAKRETDVSDTFLDSSWYFLRYPSVTESRQWNSNITKKWLPVNAYIGGAEHAVLHLLYSRFVWKCLKDWGYLDDIKSEEPFPYLFGHGLIIKDGAKMSKSKGNIVNPDEYIEKYGADTLRLYLMFLGPYDQGGDFRDTGISGMQKFIRRVWGLFTDSNKTGQKTTEKTLKKLHQTIQGMTEDIGQFRYNTAIAKLMELTNVWKEQGEKMSEEDVLSVLKLLAPFAPFVTEELWNLYRQDGSIHVQKWPEFDSKLLQDDIVTIVVQVNGRVRGTLINQKSKIKNQNEIIVEAKKIGKVKKYLEGKKIVKEIYIPGRLVNFVVS